MVAPVDWVRPEVRFLTRPPRPDDLYRLRVATDPRLSPDGQRVIVTLQTVAPTFDGYRTALWLVPTAADAGEPRQLTLGARHGDRPRPLPGWADRRVPLGRRPK